MLFFAVFKSKCVCPAKEAPVLKIISNSDIDKNAELGHEN